MPAGRSECPKPGGDGASNRQPSDRTLSTGADGSRPMWGCRKRIGRPCPRSISSMRAPLTMKVDIGGSAAAFMQAPRGVFLRIATLFVVGSSVSAGYEFGNDEQ